MNSAKLISATILVGWTGLSLLAVWYTDNTEIASTCAGVMLSIIGSWLGLDLTKVRCRSLDMPVGQCERVKPFRYGLCAVCPVILLLVLFVKYGDDGDVGMAYQLLVTAAGAPLAMFVAGVNTAKNSKNQTKKEVKPDDRECD